MVYPKSSKEKLTNEEKHELKLFVHELKRKWR